MSDHTNTAVESNSSLNWRTGLLADLPVDVNGDHPSVDDQIRLRAYELYMERGAAPNDDLGDWLQAERELREGMTAEAPGVAASQAG